MEEIKMPKKIPEVIERVRNFFSGTVVYKVKKKQVEMQKEQTNKAEQKIKEQKQYE